MNGLTKTSTACGRQRLIHTNSTHSANTPCASRLWTYGTMLEAQETKKDEYKNKDVYLQQVTNEKERIKRTKLR